VPYKISFRSSLKPFFIDEADSNRVFHARWSKAAVEMRIEYYSIFGFLKQLVFAVNKND